MDNDGNKHLAFDIMCHSRDAFIYAARLHPLEDFRLLTFDPLYILLLYYFNDFPYHNNVEENYEDAVSHEEELSGGCIVSSTHNNEGDCGE